MNMQEFENKAYEIATSNCLVETFNKEQYNEMNEEEVFVYVWEPFENFSSGELCSQIQQIADDIIRAFGHLAKEESDFIINDEVLLKDTVSGVMELTSGSGLTEDQVKDYLDENEMNTITEAMYEAQSFEIQNMVPEILEHFGLEVEDEEQLDD